MLMRSCWLEGMLTCQQDILCLEGDGRDAGNGEVWHIELHHRQQEAHLCRDCRTLQTYLQSTQACLSNFQCQSSLCLSHVAQCLAHGGELPCHM